MANRKVAFVTGSGMGIGKEIALRLADDGFDVVINARHAESLVPVSEAIRSKGVECLIAAGDVSNDDTVHEIFGKIKETFGRLDVLVNNAGICPIRKMDAVSAEEMERTFDINVVSMFLCAKAAAEIMKDQPEGGKIINAASQSSFRETPVTFEYTTTKWSIRGMTKAMADALREYNITVNAYCPGTVLTPMQDKIARESAKEMHVPAWLIRKYQLLSQPLGRFQTNEDIANLVSFLASGRSRGINGQNLLCNGGQVMN